MKSRTLVCVYGSGSEVETVFERLHAIFRMNYSDSYVYCALIDMNEAFLYRVAGDSDIESKARLACERLCKLYGDRFFCGIRQRRCDTARGERRYCCEDGASGALKAVWRYAGGRNDELFPCFGELGQGFERVYFSETLDARKNAIRIFGCDRTAKSAKIKCGKAANRIYGCDRKSCSLRENDACVNESIEVIEAGGIFKLGAELGKSGGVCAKRGSGSIGEVLLTSLALDALLSSGVAVGDLARSASKDVGFCSIPRSSAQILCRGERQMIIL